MKTFHQQMQETLVLGNQHKPLSTLVDNWRYVYGQSLNYFNLSPAQVSSLDSQLEALRYLIHTRM